MEYNYKIRYTYWNLNVQAVRRYLNVQYLSFYVSFFLIFTLYTQAVYNTFQKQIIVSHNTPVSPVIYIGLIIHWNTPLSFIILYIIQRKNSEEAVSLYLMFYLSTKVLVLHMVSSGSLDM